jgi:conjugal transfer ATP-binding protein TraC
MATKFSQIVRAITEEDGIFLLRFGKKDFGLGFAFEASPYVFANTAVETGFYQIITGELPDEGIMQVILYADDDIDHELSFIKKGQGLLGTLFEERYRYYRKAARGGGFYNLQPVRNFRLFLFFYLPVKYLGNTAEEALAKAKEIKGHIEQTLDSLKMGRKTLSYRDFSNLLDKLLYGKVKGDGATDITGLVPRNLEIIEKGRTIEIKEGRKWSVLSPYFLPSPFHIALMAKLLGSDRIEDASKNLRKPFFITTTIRKKPLSEVKKLLAKGMLINLQAQGLGGKIMPLLKEAAQDFNILRDRLNRGEKVVDLWMFGFATSEEIKKLETLFNTVAEDLFGASSFKTFIEEAPGPVLEDFMYSLPFCFPFGEKFIWNWNRHFHLLGKDAVKFLPVMGDLKGNFAKEGDYPPALCFVSPKGQVMYVDLFNSAAGYNFVIVASTGSGKSFLANETINAYLAKGAVVRVIDVGGSYEKLAKLYGAPYVEIDPENPICLNPFTHMRGTPDEFILVRDLILIMLGIDSEKVVSYEEMKSISTEVGIVEKAIREVWEEKNNKATLEDVVERLPENLQEPLYRWIENEYLRPFFVGEAQLNIKDEPFFVIDLLKVKATGDDDLFKVLMYLVLVNIQKNVYLLPRNIKKLVIFDESWEFLKDKRIVRYIERGYRIARKFNGSFGVITQSVEDFMDEHSKPIIDNSNFIFLLELGEQSLAFLEKKEGIALNDYAVYLAKTVKKHPKNLWSEILVYMRNQKMFGKARLIVDDFSKYLYSTTAEEVEKIKMLEKKVGLTAAVEILAKKNPLTLAKTKGWLTEAQIIEHGIIRLEDALAKGLISDWQYKQILKEWEELLELETLVKA